MHELTGQAPWPTGTGPRVAAVAGFLAVAALPLYLHLPRLAVEVGIPLGTVGVLLLALRTLDFAQDPLLGWLAERFRAAQAVLAGASIVALGGGFFAVFSIQPGLPGMAAALVVVFTAYSLGTIVFYGRCAEIAGHVNGTRHIAIAGWREGGSLAGILVATALPGLVGAVYGTAAGFAALGIGVAAVAPLAIWAGHRLWTVQTARSASAWRDLLRAPTGWLLLVALVNALPVGVTSTLFVFFVEDRLGAPHLTGLYLLLFFLAAGVSAPMWSLLAARHGPRRVLVPAMLATVAAFVWTAWLPVGATFAFGIIAVATGAGLGADLVILPALFSAALAAGRLPAALGFGAWNFAAKLALAVAAGTTLPALQLAGFQPGGPNSARALSALNFAYAVVPILLKLPAVWLVFRLTRQVAP